MTRVFGWKSMSTSGHITLCLSALCCVHFCQLILAEWHTQIAIYRRTIAWVIHHCVCVCVSTVWCLSIRLCSFALHYALIHVFVCVLASQVFRVAHGSHFSTSSYKCSMLVSWRNKKNMTCNLPHRKYNIKPKPLQCTQYEIYAWVFLRSHLRAVLVMSIDFDFLFFPLPLSGLLL